MLCRKGPGGHGAGHASSLEEKALFSGRLTQDPRAHRGGVYATPQLEGWHFLTQEGTALAVGLGVKKKMSRRRKLWELHFNVLPSFHYDSGWQVGNTRSRTAFLGAPAAYATCSPATVGGLDSNR